MAYDIIIRLVFFLLACLVLVGAGTLLVRSLSKIAAYLHFSEFVVGFIWMAFATSLPELFVGVNSAIARNTAVALGTVVGANILDLTIVLGIVILISRGLSIESAKIKTDALYMFVLATLPVVLYVVGNQISRLDGVVLLAALFVYVRKLFIERRQFRRVVSDHRARWTPVLHTTLFLVSLGFLFLSSHYVVKYGIELSVDLNFPAVLIGLILVPIGTTLPELVFESRAVLMGHSEMALGDLIGSVVVNSTLVLGLTALIFPITASNALMALVSGLFMIVIAFLFATFVEGRIKLNIKHGISLILLYIFFLLVEFVIKGI